MWWKIICFMSTFVMISCAASTAFAESRLWVCEYCGRRVYADNRPDPGSSCDKNHNGKHHVWQEIDKHGKNCHWMCEYCGHGVTADTIPGTGGCTKNPYGTKVHHWLKK